VRLRDVIERSRLSSTDHQRYTCSRVQCEILRRITSLQPFLVMHQLADDDVSPAVNEGRGK
jgi:hypothetical protein